MAKMVNDAVAMPPLVITPDRGLAADGNFQQILGRLKLREREVAKMKLTEDNVEQAKLIKKEAGAYRKAAEERLKNAVELLFDGPKAVLKSKAQEVFSAIDRIESSALAVLDKIEANRVEDLTRAFDSYRDDFQERYQLNEETWEKIAYPKWYYNKTPADNEKKAKDDLEELFKKLKQQQDALESDKTMIKSLCADDDRLDVDMYLKLLGQEPASSVAARITAQKELLTRLGEEDAPVQTKIGLPISVLSFQTDFPGKTLKKRIELEYPYDMGDEITEVFRALRKSGVKVRSLKEETVF
jgi:hypothetical protein